MGCRRLVHFINYLTIYLAQTLIDIAAMSCYTSFPLRSTSCIEGAVWLGPEQHKLCIGTSAKECHYSGFMHGMGS